MTQVPPKPPKRHRPPVTGLRFNRDLIKQMKHRALDENTTLTKLIEKALQAYLRGTRQ